METPLQSDLSRPAAETSSLVERVTAVAPVYFALIVAWTATLGSLYFSEVRHYEPCELCWYQRIFMYPLALLLPLGLLRRDRSVPYYGLALVLAGAPISTYHVLLQKTDWFLTVHACGGPVPCHIDYINWFGFVTIPVLALTAFVLIGLSLSAARRDPNPAWATAGSTPWLPVLVSIGVVAALYALIWR